MYGTAFEDRWRQLPTSSELFGPVDPEKMERKQFCREVVDCFERYGIVFMTAPKTDEELTDDMMRAMGQFFAASEAVQRQTITENFQGGLLPEGTERPDPDEQASHFARLSPENYPFPTPNDRDMFKKRFMVKVGDAPPMTRFPGLTPATKIIAGHERLYELCARWGNRMLPRMRILLDAYAEYYGLSPTSFPTYHGAHFVAPTGSDFVQYRPGTVIADVHGDMGFVTGHDPSKVVFGDNLELRPCGGLVGWSSDGRLFRVVVPKGTQPWQGGFQFRHMTGGRVHAGMHQVIVPPEAADIADEARRRGTTAMRTTGTIFCHGTADEKARVPDVFRQPGIDYEDIYLGDIDERVLKKIELQPNT